MQVCPDGEYFGHTHKKKLFSLSLSTGWQILIHSDLPRGFFSIVLTISSLLGGMRSVAWYGSLLAMFFFLLSSINKRWESIIFYTNISEQRLLLVLAVGLELMHSCHIKPRSGRWRERLRTKKKRSYHFNLDRQGDRYICRRRTHCQTDRHTPKPSY